MIRVALRRNAAGLVVPILLLALAARLAGVADAQDAPESGASAAADSQSTVRLSVVTNSRLGQLTYVPEQWGELQLRLDNTGATARDVLCSSYFNDDQTLQYARQVWLPPRSRLAISTPALVPQADRFPSNSGRIQSLMIDRSQGSEVLLASDSGKLRQEQPVLVAPEARHTGIIAGWETGDEVPVDAVNLIVASRVAQSLNNRLTVLTGHFLPSDEISLRYLDHLVIAENRLLDDPAAMDAVRRWLHGGGRLWIMLDRVDPLILERLLGDDFQGHLVERVSLTSIRIDKAPSFSAPNGEDGEVHEYEEPVDMARVAVSGIKVWNTVDGWPVAMSCSSGEGRVLITTLGARAWYGPAQPNKESKVKPLSDFAPLPPMVDLTAYVLATRDEPPLPQSTLQPIAQEYVSYTVPTWSLVVGTMGVFLALLFATGFWLWRRERLEHFGWTGSLLAVVFGMALTGIGMANHYGVPDAISSVQVVQAVSGTDDVTTHGVVGVYRSEGSQAPIQATLGGRLWPELAVEGETRRMVTTDLGEFTWEGVTQPAGLRMYSDVTAAAYPARIAAQGTVDAAGVVGRYEGCTAAGTEAVLATQYGRMAVTLSADGQFSAATGGILDKDEFLKATFVGDVQDRRRRLLQDLFKNRGWIDSLDRPQLLLWLDGWEHGFQFGDGLQPAGETLLTVPLEFTRPAAGTELVIPSPLISYSTARPPDGSLPTGFWDELRHEWQERSSPSTTWLDFQVPEGLLPLKVTRGTLSAKVSGPMGQFEILGVRNGTVESLESIPDPVGTLVIDIDDAELLSLSEDGQLSLGVSAGASSGTGEAGLSGGGTANYWRIESLSLQLWATAADASEVE